MCKVLYKSFDLEMPSLTNRNPDGNVGYDIHAVLTDLPGVVDADDTLALMFAPYEQRKIPVNVAVAPVETIVVGGLQLMPWFLVLGRSGMNEDHWTVQPGVIDPNYRGQFNVLIQNHTDEPQIIRHGDRIAQLVPLLSFKPDWQSVPELPPSDRGTAGFGSSGR